MAKDTAPTRMLTLEAGGRLRVLRHCLAALCKRLPTTLSPYPDHGYRWQLDQPTLWIMLPPDAPVTDTVIAAEQLLDELMARHPWEEQPLLDWTGAGGPRCTRVQIEASADAAAAPKSTLAGTALAEVLGHLQLQDGARIKEAALQALCAAVVRFPALRRDDLHLLEQIQPTLRGQVAARLASLEAGPVRYAGALPATLLDALEASDAHGACRLIDTAVNRLGLRPDEGAYLQLIAQTLSRTSRKTHEPALH